MKLKKIAVVINNRANYARIRSFLIESKKFKKLKIQLIIAASSLVDKFGDLEKIIRKDKLSISKKLYTIIDGDKPVTMAKSTAIEISELANLFEDSKPNYVFAIADRFETLSVAVAASYMNIPLIHLQGGEITGSIDESVRHAISKFANIHFPATDLAKKNLVRMGEDPKTIFNFGCPSIDIAKKIKNKKSNIYEIFKEHNFSKQEIFDLRLIKNYLVIVQHPVTTEYKKTKRQIIESIKAISRINMFCVWLWPNVDSGSDIISKQLRIYREKGKLNNVLFVKNITPESFLSLIKDCKCLIGNSSVGIRESSYLGVPTVNIGLRQNGRERANNVIDVIHSSDEITKAIKRQIKNGKYKSSTLYGKGNAGLLIAKKLLNINITNTQKKLNYAK
ncbi:UDP-N-acetylglucosamine 2-epimerase [Candidatus Pelagibacter sp.]|nr:UDP-N-acetylglucosamine 2-epimerase [Candidatus Pelagibacter sp.]